MVDGLRVDQRVRVLQVGFVGLFVLVLGFMCLSLYSPVESAPSPGTCLPISKGGTNCEPLPITLGGTGADTPLLARGNLGFNTICSAQTITTDMANLQTTIDGLPKYLCGDVTVNVVSGTYAGTITIERFSGPGKFEINAITGTIASPGSTITTAGVTTHMADRFIIQLNNSAGKLDFRGFTATTDNNSSFTIINNSSFVTIGYCNATAGLNTTSANYGFNMDRNTAVWMNDNTVSNKSYAFYDMNGGTSVVVRPQGTNNSVIYRAVNSSDIRITNAGTITGTTTYSTAIGGIIFDPGGNQRGNTVAVESSGTITADGFTFTIYRTRISENLALAWFSVNAATTTNVANGALLATIPAGYRPTANTRRAPVKINTSMGIFTISTAGAMTLTDSSGWSAGAIITSDITYMAQL